MGAMDRIAGRKPRVVETAPLPRLLVTKREAAAMVGGEVTLRHLLTAGLLRSRVVPTRGRERPLRRYLVEDVIQAVREFGEKR